MQTRSFNPAPDPELFATSEFFSQAINHRIVRSEIEGGVHMRDLAPGARLAVETRNRTYHMVCLNCDEAMIEGHPEFCPRPVRVRVHGCTWGGSMLKARYVGRGMHLEFEHPDLGTVVTSRIVDIRQLGAAA